MGIVAFCPTGHRVKVKDHLAGKKGICPQCGATFRIPAATAAPDSAPAGTGLPQATVVSLDHAVAAALPPVIVLADPPPAEPIAMAEPFAAPAEESPPPRLIAEAPGSTWCWAIPGGQPSPQMSGESMRSWLDSGAVKGDELVWRSDWADWVSVREAFPEVCPGASARDFRWP